MATLYEIKGELDNCFKQDDMVVNGQTGEVFDASYLDHLNMQLDEKIDNIAAFIKNLTADNGNCDEQIAYFQNRKKQNTRRIEWLKKYLADNLGSKKYVTTRAEVSFRNTKAVEIVDENKLPDEYKKIKTTYTPDKKSIKQAIESGNPVEGAELVVRRSTIVK